MVICSTFKKFIQKFLGTFSLTLANLHRVPDWNQSFEILRHYSLIPKTVFDIGVANGTPNLYAAFPDAYYHLFDPTRESIQHMEQIAKRHMATIYTVGLAVREGEAEIAVRAEIGGSSMLTEVGRAEITDRYKVPLNRFDALIPAGIERPALAKIDVQGAEIGVLRGMEGRLGELDAILIETSLIATLIDGPEFRDVFRFFDRHDWVLADIPGLVRRPLDGGVAQIDALFVPATSPIRADKRWRE